MSKRPNCEALDYFIENNVKFPVLNDGFIRVVDYMGNDSSIVQAARISYGEGTKKVTEDTGLIRYLLRNYHTTPFEMAELKLHIRVPMDCWRQWIRHRTFSVNEYSTRYSEAINSMQTTSPEEWRTQSSTNKQGSGEYLTDGELLTAREKQFQTDAVNLYNERLDLGVAREQARKDLPLCTYTEAYWKGNLHNILHFLRLRMDSHAQKEIRQYATVIGENIIKVWMPTTWDAFLDYRMNNISISAIDKIMIKAIQNGTWIDEGTNLGWFDKDGNPKRNRERNEFEIKMTDLNLPTPWL